MKKRISDKIRSLDERELSELMPECDLCEYQKNKIKNRTLEKTGLKAERKNVMKKFSWKKVAAIAACLCVVICAVVVCANVFGNNNKPIDNPPSIRGDFMGLTMLKAYVGGDSFADDHEYELVLMRSEDITTEYQTSYFENLGMRTEVNSDGSIHLFATKTQLLSLELTGDMQFMWFNLLSENK